MIPTHPMHEILRLGRLDEVVFELVRAIRFVDATPRAAICRRKQQHTHSLSLSRSQLDWENRRTEHWFGCIVIRSKASGTRQTERRGPGHASLSSARVAKESEHRYGRI